MACILSPLKWLAFEKHDLGRSESFGISCILKSVHGLKSAYGCAQRDKQPRGTRKRLIDGAVDVAELELCICYKTTGRADELRIEQP
jgi:hypothetical protein